MSRTGGATSVRIVLYSKGLAVKLLRTLPALLLLAPLIVVCNPNRMEDLIADLAGTWFGNAGDDGVLNLDIEESGNAVLNYKGEYFIGQASLYGTQFDFSSSEIEMSGQYTAESERLEGNLTDYRDDPDNPDVVNFTLYRVKE